MSAFARVRADELCVRIWSEWNVRLVDFSGSEDDDEDCLYYNNGG